MKYIFTRSFTSMYLDRMQKYILWLHPTLNATSLASCPLCSVWSSFTSSQKHRLQRGGQTKDIQAMPVLKFLQNISSVIVRGTGRHLGFSRPIRERGREAGLVSRPMKTAWWDGTLRRTEIERCFSKQDPSTLTIWGAHKTHVKLGEIGPCRVAQKNLFTPCHPHTWSVI